MTLPTVKMTGKVESFTTKARDTEEGPKLTTKVVLAVTTISGDLDELVGYTAHIVVEGVQAKFGAKP